jgi:hypothetical protein
VTYQAINTLTFDQPFTDRVRACCMEQAEVFKNDARPDFVSLANDQLTGGITFNTFVRISAASPGIAAKADNGDGTIDSSKVTDADLLSLVQANWQVVAGLFFNEDGSPK